MQLPIIIGLHRSRLIDLFVGICAGLASLAVVCFPVSFLLQGALLSGVWGIALLAWRQCSPKLSAIRLELDGQVSIQLSGESEFLLAELLPGAHVHPWLTIFRLKTGTGDTLPLVVASDSLCPEDFRRLRVFLRWRADFSGRGDAA